MTISHVYEIKVGGRKLAILSPHKDLAAQADGIYEIRVQIPQRTTLRVIDESSGEHLSGIQLVAADYRMRKFLVHPGQEYDDRKVASGLQSPASIDEYASKLFKTRDGPGPPSLALVGAEGYAWKSIPIDFQAGGEYTVALQPGASLLVRVNGVDATTNAQLRVRKLGQLPSAEVTLERDEQFRFDGLAPGPYSIRAEIGKSFLDSILLAEVEVELQADQLTTIVDLDLRPAPSVKLAPAGGIVHLADHWVKESDRDSIMVTANFHGIPIGDQKSHLIEWAEEVDSERAGYRSFRWTIEATQIGSYTFHLPKRPLNVQVQIPEGGVTDLEWTLDPPVKLIVHAVGALTNLPVTTKGLLWAPHHEVDFDLAHSAYATVGSQAGVHEILAPLIKIDLWVSDDRYRWYEQTIDLQGGTREMTIRLVPLYRMSIELWSQGTLIPFPKKLSSKDVIISGPGDVIQASTRDLTRDIQLSESGIYTVELPKFPGYLKPQPQRVNVLTTEPVLHRIELFQE